MLTCPLTLTLTLTLSPAARGEGISFCYALLVILG